jgi:hypothetical protein
MSEEVEFIHVQRLQAPSILQPWSPVLVMSPFEWKIPQWDIKNHSSYIVAKFQSLAYDVLSLSIYIKYPAWLKSDPILITLSLGSDRERLQLGHLRMTSKFAYDLKISTNRKRAFIKRTMCNSSLIEGTCMMYQTERSMATTSSGSVSERF